MLAEKGLPFERIDIDVTRGENRSPEFLRLNPRGKVPVLVHLTPSGQVVVSESSVINEYLEDAFPAPALMPPGAAERAAVRQLIHLFDTELSPTTGLLIIEKLLKPAAAQRPEFIAERLAATREILSRLLSMAAPGPYLVGDYSLADASFTPVMAVLGACGIALETEFPPLARWLAEIKQRPSYKASEQ